MAHIRFSDLTGLQVRNIERAIGLPAHKWDEATSDVELMAHIAAEALGGTSDEYLAKPWSELTKLVALEEDEDTPGND